jgi:hypothetical protein
MHIRQRRKVAGRMAKALRYLQREARAAALDEVAAAIARAELSIIGACRPDAGPPGADRPALPAPRRERGKRPS